MEEKESWCEYLFHASKQSTSENKGNLEEDRTTRNKISDFQRFERKGIESGFRKELSSAWP